MTMTSTELSTGERADLLQALAQRRYFLRYTVRDLTDEQAALHPTASELCLGGLIQHVCDTERQWVDFILDGPASSPAADDAEAMQAWLNRFQMAPGVTLEAILADYAEVAERTDQVIRDLPDLDLTHPLPEAPWYEPGASWSARQVVLHIIAETAQHSGHADILRESIDGAKSMG
jgi:uncharacterized damage-inducible protein DinB